MSKEKLQPSEKVAISSKLECEAGPWKIRLFEGEGFWFLMAHNERDGEAVNHQLPDGQANKLWNQIMHDLLPDGSNFQPLVANVLEQANP